jgi:hypothetical protein
MAGRCSINKSTQQVNKKDIWSFHTDSNPILKFTWSVELPFSSISATWLCWSVPHKNCTPPTPPPPKKKKPHCLQCLYSHSCSNTSKWPQKLFPTKHSRILFLCGQKLFNYNCKCFIWLLTAYTSSITFKMTTIVHVTVKMSCLVVALLFRCQFIIGSK